MDRELPAKVVRQSKIKKVIVAGAVLIFLLICYFALQALMAPTLNRSRIRTSVAEIGSIEATVSATGVVIPEYEQLLTAPVNSTIEEVSLKTGDSVHAGQSILKLNRDQLLSSHSQMEDQLRIELNRKDQISLEAEKKLIDLQTSYDIKNLQARYAESKYDRAKRLQAIGGSTLEEVERAALDAEIVRRELNQIGDEIENQKSSLKVTQEGLDLEIGIQQKGIAEIRRQIDLAEAKATRDGVITFVNEDIGSPVGVGDILARVADLSSFKVEASISDIHADKLKPGGLVQIRVGDKKMPGHISNVRPAVKNGIMTFMVEPEDKSSSLLRPNLRVDVFVVTSFKEDVIRVENGPFYDGLVDQEVFVVEGDKAVRHIVDIGVASFDKVELKGDIAAGDEVIISDMKKFRHMQEVEIKEN